MSLPFVEAPHLSAGFYQSLVLGDGERSLCYSFGSHRNHLQGAENVEKLSFAEPFPLDLSTFNVASVGCGGCHSCILEKRPGEEGGQVWVWGLGNGGRLAVERPRKSFEVQKLLKECLNAEENKLLSDKSYVQSFTGSAKKWALHLPRREEPFLFEEWFRLMFRHALKAFLSRRVDFGSAKMVSVSCGTDFTLALSEDGEVYAWGQGSHGQLGLGVIGDQWTPQLVAMGVGCRQVAAGTKHGMALGAFGEVFTWGHGGHGRLGQGVACAAALRPVPLTLTARYVAAGEAHSGAIDQLGQVWCWGAGSFGRCGHGEEVDFMVPKLVAALVGKGCQQMALGVCHSMALTLRGRIWSWGGCLYTGHGELDDIETAMELDHEALSRPKSEDFNGFQWISAAS